MTPLRPSSIGRALDRLGRFELAAIGIWVGAVFGLETVQLADDGQSAAPGLLAWLIGASTAVVAGVLTMVLIARHWRKHGGRRMQRAGRRAWLTGYLPHELPARLAVLADLQRRDRALTRTWLPAWVTALFWTALVLDHLLSQQKPLTTWTWLAVWSVFLAIGALDFLDRRTRPRLRRLITQLQQDPLGIEPLHVHA